MRSSLVGPPSQNVEVFLNGDNNFVTSQAESMLYLYDSLRMFYSNGGGKCYIVSVGPYPSAPAGILAADIEAGLLELEKEDEPTIILMPEAVSVSGGPYSLQQKALAQSSKLMDRVAICDLEKATDTTTFNTKVSDFRNGIGINDLKYGAAYWPVDQCKSAKAIAQEESDSETGRHQCSHSTGKPDNGCRYPEIACRCCAG